eukprot:SAG31_NODE_8855_length_1374_cov_1.159216_1_plen_73_part_00
MATAAALPFLLGLLLLAPPEQGTAAPTPPPPPAPAVGAIALTIDWSAETRRTDTVRGVTFSFLCNYSKNTGL